jgi:hypothetical protein
LAEFDPPGNLRNCPRQACKRAKKKKRSGPDDLGTAKRVRIGSERKEATTSGIRPVPQLPFLPLPDAF